MDSSAMYSGDDKPVCGDDGDTPGRALANYLEARDLETQVIISVVLGATAFLSFCILRPRWTGLYAARKKYKNAASTLPKLPSSLLGWIPVLWRITEEEVLASAGLDAFAFLRFFKMATKYLAVVFFFVLTVIYPVHKAYGIENGSRPKPGDDPDSDLKFFARDDKGNGTTPQLDTTAEHIPMYVIFAYVFTGVAMYLIVTETNYVVRVRQRYLSTQSTVSDRTIRLSGIPKELQSEEKIKETIENLEIGKVQRVSLCRNWKELDEHMEERAGILRKLEEAWTVYLGYQRAERNLDRSSVASNPNIGGRPYYDGGNDDAGEDSALLPQSENSAPSKARPQLRIWYGFMNLKYHKVDAIDHYEEKLRQIDKKIYQTRKSDFAPTALAFITLDSIAACQMAIQATLDSKPMTLLAHPAPAPADVVWKNTYLTRSQRMTRAWIVTFFVVLLTVVWWVAISPVIALMNVETIHKISPSFGDFLCDHETSRTLVKTTLPTLLLSLLMVLVPFLYNWMSNLQGMISQGDVEMSVISKNFFFTFFNLFVTVTLLGTAANAFSSLDSLWKQFENLQARGVLTILANSLAGMSGFYTNLVILQAIGLSPFKLLEFGAVSLYPINLIGSKTPRDYAELLQPPTFSYGFYMPQVLFILLICMTYSVFPGAQWIILFGLIYFISGAFIYKYQLLYAMDHRSFSTGRAWMMSCNRMVVGLLIFQLTTSAQVTFKKGLERWGFVLSLLMLPLLAGTVWFGVVYNRIYSRLMKYIALRSVHDAQDFVLPMSPQSRLEEEIVPLRVASEEDFSRHYVNPNLVIKLEKIWLSKSQTKWVNASNGNQNGRNLV